MSRVAVKAKPVQVSMSAVVRRDGLLMWLMVERGPRGGLTSWYAPRGAKATQPSPWCFWSRAQCDVDGSGVVAHDAVRQ